MLKLIKLIFIFFFAFSSLAEDNSVELTADELEHKKIGNEDVIIAKGHIEAAYGKEVVKADKIIYYQQSKLVKAYGNVLYQDAAGNKIFADSAEFKDRFKQALIINFTDYLREGSVVKGKKAEKDPKQDKYIIKETFYTSCDFCPGKSPIWSIQAEEAVIYPKTEDIEFKGIKFYAGELPIFYFPYFAHTTNLSKRKSGFLRGDFGQNSNLGLYAKIPYYYNIAPDKDLTFTLFSTTSKGFLYDVEYRQLTDNGNFRLAPLFTIPKDKKSRILYGDIRYNIRADGQLFDNDSGRMIFQIDYLSDSTLLKTFDYDDKGATRSYLNYSFNEDDGYTRVSTIYFQNFRLGQERNASPVILPYVENKKHYNFEGGFYYDRFSNLLLLQERNQYNLGRFSLDNTIGYRFSTANIYASARTDGYNYNDINIKQNPFAKQTFGRFIPTLGADYKYPLFKSLKSNLLILEPQVDAKISPNRDFNKYVYNEDSRDYDLSYANLFDNSHFPGLDIVEPGARVSYGGKVSYYTSTDRYLSLMLGQAFSTKEFSFYNGRLIQTGFSNYVGEIKYKFNREFTAWSKVRVDKHMRMQTNEINAYYTIQDFTFFLGYYFYQDKFFMHRFNAKRRELEGSSTWQINTEWAVSLKTSANISSNKSSLFKRGLTTIGGSVTYFYDCIGFTIAYSKDFTKIKYEKPAESIDFRIKLKNIMG